MFSVFSVFSVVRCVNYAYALRNSLRVIVRTSINEYREKKERVSYIYIYMNVFFYIYIVEDLNQCEVLKINLPSLLFL